MVTDEMKEKCPYYETKCDDLQCACPKYQAFLDVQDSNIVEQELKILNVADLKNWQKIFNIQKHFANRFHKVDKVSKEDTDKWVKEYCICIEDEIEEFLDYMPWNGMIKLDNDKEMLKEVIDVLHFVMDVMIAGNCSPDEIQKRYIEEYMNGNNNFNDFFTAAFENERKLLCKEKNIKIVDNPISGKNIYNISEEEFYQMTTIAALEVMILDREIRQQISWKHWKNPNETINYDKLFKVFTLLFKRFIILCVMVFVTSDEIVNMYIMKNIENVRRQKNGY